MIDVIEILTHWYAGRSQNELATSLGVDRKTLRKQEAQKTLMDCLRQLLRQIDAWEIVADDGQRAYLQGALYTAEHMAAEHARVNRHGRTLSAQPHPRADLRIPRVE